MPIMPSRNQTIPKQAEDFQNIRSHRTRILTKKYSKGLNDMGRFIKVSPKWIETDDKHCTFKLGL